MATNYWRFEARNQAELDALVSKYIVAGFYMANRTPTMVTLVKRKQFSILALVIGLVLCVLPLLFYLVIYMLERDRVVEIFLEPDPQIGLRSDDGHYWWDGTSGSRCRLLCRYLRARRRRHQRSDDPWPAMGPGISRGL